MKTRAEGACPHLDAKYALDQARAQMQVCTLYFGKVLTKTSTSPNSRISGSANRGRIWCICRFGVHRLDPAVDVVRPNQFKVHRFVQEVTPHEVAHQWFGHGAGWASYHDQWLRKVCGVCRGIVSAASRGPKWQKDYIEFWERSAFASWKKIISAFHRNDAGPLCWESGSFLRAPGKPIRE